MGYLYIITIIAVENHCLKMMLLDQ